MSQLDPPTPNADRNADRNVDRPKPLGEYLVEAKLLTPAHIEVALYDQRERGYRLGDILALRGWVKEEIIEWIVQNKLLPERQVEEEDFDTLLLNLQDVLRQKEAKQQQQERTEEADQSPGQSASQLPSPSEREKAPPKPNLVDICERDTLIIEVPDGYAD